GDDELRRLASEDVGFQTAARVREILIEDAKPALVLVNGLSAVWALESVEGEHVQLSEVRYELGGKRLRHWKGSYRAGSPPIPLVVSSGPASTRRSPPCSGMVS